MIRRIIDFIIILLFVWVCMILGLWIIDRVIVPMNLAGVTNNLLSAIFKVGISAFLVLIWLWIWREIVKRSFWHAIKKQQDY
ncbi:MAG: hypothetical protein QXI71_03500 [Candidatus Bathyarchaeia archaeon]|nr:hypothetical protein [Candidatus Bathyarchaeota archaeon]